MLFLVSIFFNRQFHCIDVQNLLLAERPFYLPCLQCDRQALFLRARLTGQEYRRYYN